MVFVRFCFCVPLNNSIDFFLTPVLCSTEEIIGCACQQLACLMPMRVRADDSEALMPGYPGSYNGSFRLPEPNLDARKNSLTDLSDIFDFPVGTPDMPQERAA